MRDFTNGERVEVLLGKEWIPGSIWAVDTGDDSLPYRVQQDDGVVTGWVPASDVRQPAPAEQVESAEVVALREARLKTAQIQAEFDSFKQAVRQKAIELRDDNKWCIEGINEAFDELGLDPITRKVRLEFKAIGTWDCTLEIETDRPDEDITAEWVAEHLDSGEDLSWDEEADDEQFSITSFDVRDLSVEDA